MSGPRAPGGRPAKVFGVGLQRTGTHSMTVATRTLGYRSNHFPAKLWDDLEDDVLRRFDAFFDNPIPILYPSLDARCPGSRFILTVRDPDEWVASVEWMFENRRDEWNFDTDRRIREMHLELYGRNDFDRDVFLEVYRRHDDAVREYFSDRPEALLVLDVSDPDPWDALCAFLERERPDVPFPHTNRGSAR